jgi:nitrogen fixation protein FixH
MPKKILEKTPSKNKYKAIPYFFLFFFLTFITVDIAYIFVAEKTWRGLATEDGYQKGLKYNDTIEAVKEQKQLGWKLQIKYQPSASKIGNLQVTLTDKTGKIIRDAILTANIRRPVQEGKDFSVDLKFNNKTSIYQSTIEFPLIGQWDIEIVAKKGDDVYQDVKRLVIK